MGAVIGLSKKVRKRYYELPDETRRNGLGVSGERGWLLLDLVTVGHPTNTLFDLFGLVFVILISGDAVEAFRHDELACLRRVIPVAFGVFSA